MEAASSSILSTRPPHHPTRYPLGLTRLRLPKNPITVGSASKRDGYGWDYGGELVDENMVVLRKRIHEMRVAERGDPDPPSDWMQWEKNYYASSYGSDVCEAVGLIQILLMGIRPSVAVGFVGLLILSVPTSVILVGLHLMEALRSVLN